MLRISKVMIVADRKVSDASCIISRDDDEKYRGIVRRSRCNDRSDCRTERPGCAFDGGELAAARELNTCTARLAGAQCLVCTRTLGRVEGGRYSSVRDVLAHAVWFFVHANVPAGRLPARTRRGRGEPLLGTKFARDTELRDCRVASVSTASGEPPRALLATDGHRCASRAIVIRRGRRLVIRAPIWSARLSRAVFASEA